MRFFIQFLIDVIKNRTLLWQLAVRQFLSGSFGSMLGIVWVIIEPLAYIGVLFFFFTKAIKFTPSGSAPYLPWLMCGMSLWQFFNHALNSLINTFKNNSYFLKKWQFNLAILPVSSLISSLFLHFIFLAILMVVFILSGVEPSLYWLQSFYYLFALASFLLGLGWLVGSLSLFFQDVRNLVSVCLQFGFWLSPIFWDAENAPAGFGKIVALNPLSYVMQGYRDSFLNNTGFWVYPKQGAIFWGLTAVVLFVGSIAYRKMRPHFGDVLQ